jgi:hypothetical protein
MSYSDSGNYGDVPFDPQSSHLGAGSRIALFFLEDERLGPLLSEAYRMKDDELAFSRDLTEDLGIYSQNLSLEKSDERKNQAGAFITSKKEFISREIYARIDNMSTPKYKGIQKDKVDKQAVPGEFPSQGTGDPLGIKAAEAPRQEPAGESLNENPLHDHRTFESLVLSGPAFEEMIQRIKFNNGLARSTRQVKQTKKEELVGRCHDETPQPSPLVMDNGNMLPWAKLRKIFSKLVEPSIPPGKRRLRWQCCCGEFLWDDYSNSAAYDFDRLEKELGQLFRSQPHGSGDCRRSGSPSGLIALVRQVFASVTKPLQKAARSGAEGIDLEYEERAGATEQDDQCQSILLTSVTCGSGFPMLIQKPFSAIDSDQQYFSMLRNIYEPEKWSGRWWAGLHAIVGIHYARVSASVRLFEDFKEHIHTDVSFNSWKSFTMTMCTSRRSPTGHQIRGIVNTHLAKAISPNLNSNLLSLT